MKRFARILLLVIGIAFTTPSIFAEVQVLPAGTIVTKPQAPSATLGESMFLLDRGDMESATLAMETVAIREEQIKKLTASYDTLRTWTIIGFIALPVAAVLLDELVHALVAK